MDLRVTPRKPATENNTSGWTKIPVTHSLKKFSAPPKPKPPRIRVHLHKEKLLCRLPPAYLHVPPIIPILQLAGLCRFNSGFAVSRIFSNHQYPRLIRFPQIINSRKTFARARFIVLHLKNSRVILHYSQEILRKRKLIIKLQQKSIMCSRLVRHRS